MKGLSCSECKGLSRRGFTIFLIASVVIFAAMEAFSQEQIPSRNPAFGIVDFQARRASLIDSLGEGTAILYSLGGDGEAGYRADGDFWYLTGLDQPGAILVLSPNEIDKEVLLLPQRNIEEERWTGERPALSESLQAAWGFDRIFRVASLDGLIVSRMKHSPTLHLISRPAGPSSDIPADLEYYGKVSARIPGVSIKNSSRFLEKLRMVKDEKEIDAVSTAIEVTYNGLSDLVSGIRPGIMEFQLKGILEQSFKKQGAQHSAFPPIIGSGMETTILHYEKLDRKLESGQLLLLDIGAQWDHYCADITRTVPVDGRFTEEQAKIYDIVLKAQKAAIDAVKLGATLRDIDDAAKNVIRKAGYIDEFIHSTSHHIGLEVHDVGDYWLPLAPGMIITVEPGIYLPDSEIGIRIEDDVLVTEKGHKVLSERIPRERDDIEAWMAGAGSRDR